jgi:hypothetical protein
MPDSPGLIRHWREIEGKDHAATLPYARNNPPPRPLGDHDGKARAKNE